MAGVSSGEGDLIVEANQEEVEEEGDNRTTILELQKDFANYFGYGNYILWDQIPATSPDALREKIRLVIPNQGSENDISTYEELWETIFNSLWEQRVYTNGNLLLSILYVFVTNEEDAPNSRSFSVHPVFRTWKCSEKIEENGEEIEDTKNCCKIFVDEQGRVYENWKQFINKNVLPPGFMVAPRNGVYTFVGEDEIDLEVVETPANGVLARALDITDKVSIVGALGATVVAIGATATTLVAAPVIAGATALGATIGVYNLARSGADLIDRKTHNQSVSLTNKNARNLWLGVGGGLCGFGSTVATNWLCNAAAQGRNISGVTQLSVNTVNIASTAVNGISCANEFCLLGSKWKTGDLTMGDILQASAALYLVTHSIRNFKLASNIINEVNAAKISNHRKDLNKNQRRRFNKRLRKLTEQKGLNAANRDIVRIINDVKTDTPITSRTIITNFRAPLEYLSKMVIDRILNRDSFEDAVINITEQLSTDAVKYAFSMLNKFIKEEVKLLEQHLHFIIPTENVFGVFLKLIKTLEVITLEQLRSYEDSILNNIKIYFKSLRNRNNMYEIISCSKCSGSYSKRPC